MEEKIDILLATYNGEKYLKEQIDSILNQTYKNIRIIISDDCSTDKTREILQEYEKKDERISVYYQKQNLGCVKNFDFLLQKVENKLYMLSDQDDIWLPEKIEKSVKTLEKENADLVFCDLEIVDEELKTINSSFCKSMKLDKKIKKCISSYKMQYLYNCITGCTILSKKEYIKDILPIPTKSKHIIHDHWIGLVVLLKNGKVAFLDESCIKYRQHRENQVGVKKKSYGYDKIIVYGGLGGRIDHEIVNIRLCEQFANKITFVDENNKLTAYSTGTYEFKKEYQYISEGERSVRSVAEHKDQNYGLCRYT